MAEICRTCHVRRCHDAMPPGATGLCSFRTISWGKLGFTFTNKLKNIPMIWYICMIWGRDSHGTTINNKYFQNTNISNLKSLPKSPEIGVTRPDQEAAGTWGLKTSGGFTEFAARLQGGEICRSSGYQNLVNTGNHRIHGTIVYLPYICLIFMERYSKWR